MTETAMETLSALVDGEAGDPDDIATALAWPGAREAIVDLVRLRALVAADDARPSPRLYAAIDEALGPGRTRTLAPRRILHGLAAAAVLALAALGAASLSHRFQRLSDQPPPATRVLRFTPGVDWHEEEAR